MGSIFDEYQPRTFEELEALLKRVDLLAHAQTPAEIKGHTKYMWLRHSSGGYSLNCGSTRFALIELDPLGHARLLFTKDGDLVRASRVETDDLKLIIGKADAIIAGLWPDASVIANKDAAWRDRPATEKQIKLARWMRVKLPSGQLTRGQVSSLIDAARIEREKG